MQIRNNKHILISLGNQAWNIYKTCQAYYYKIKHSKLSPKSLVE